MLRVAQKGRDELPFNLGKTAEVHGFSTFAIPFPELETILNLD